MSGNVIIDTITRLSFNLHVSESPQRVKKGQGLFSSPAVVASAHFLYPAKVVCNKITEIEKICMSVCICAHTRVSVGLVDSHPVDFTAALVCSLWTEFPIALCPDCVWDGMTERDANLELVELYLLCMKLMVFFPLN